MTDKDIYVKLLGLFRPYWKSAILIITSLFFSVFFEISIPYINTKIIDDGVLAKNITLLYRLGFLIVLFSCASFVLSMYREYKRSQIQVNIFNDLYNNIFYKIYRTHIDFFKNKNETEVFGNLYYDIENVSNIANESTFYIVYQILKAFGGLIGMCYINPILTVIVVACVLLKIVIYKYLAIARKSLMGNYINCNGQFACWFGDTISGIAEIKLFGIFKNKQLEFDNKLAKLNLFSKKFSIMNAFSINFDNMISQILNISIYVVAAFLMVNDDSLSIGFLFAFMIYASYVISSVAIILNTGYSLSNIVPCAHRYYDMLLKEKEENFQGNKRVDNFKTMKFVDVSFGYIDGSIVLSKINFEISKGDKIGIVGSNGSGKTTLINLILRFYENIEGEITLNDINIKEFDLEKYRTLFSTITQYLYLFDETIKSNIELYRPNDKLLIETIKNCNLESLYSAVGNEYKTGKNGSKLSGGQKQKIAIARAMYSNREVILLDEATSNLDKESEFIINELLKTVFADKTVIIVTHRQDVLKYMDKVISLENGNLEHIDMNSY